MTPNYESLAEWQKATVRKLYEDRPEVLSNLHRIIVQVGEHTGIVQSVVMPWLLEEETPNFETEIAEGPSFLQLVEIRGYL